MSENAKLAEIVTWPGVQQMCRELGISLNRGYSLLWAGRVAAHKIGGEWRVSPQSIERYSVERKARRHGR